MRTEQTDCVGPANLAGPIDCTALAIVLLLAAVPIAWILKNACLLCLRFTIIYFLINGLDCYK